MKRLRKILIYLFLLLIIFVFVIAGIAYKLYPEDLNIKWDRLATNFKYIGGINFQISLAFENLVVQKNKPYLNLPFSKVYLKASLYPIKRQIALHELEIRALRKLSIQTPQTSEHNIPFDTMQIWYDRLQVTKNHFVIENVKLVLQELVFNKVSIFLAGKTIGTLPKTFEYVSKVRKPKVFSFSSRGTISSKTAIGKVWLAGWGIQTHQKYKIDFKKPLEVNSQGLFFYKTAKTNLTAHFRISPRKDSLEWSGKLKTHIIHFSKTLNSTLLGKFILNPLHLETSLEVNDTVSPGITAQAKILLDIKEQNNIFIFKPYINTQLKIVSLKEAKPILSSLGAWLPAPLDVLDGHVNVDLEGPTKTTLKHYTFKANAHTKLSSRNQSVDITMNTDFEITRTFKSAQADISVLINDMQLQLPPLKPRYGRMRIFPDKRISQSKKEFNPKKNNFALNVNFSVKSKKGESIRLLSEYFHPYIPVSVNIKNFSGAIDVAAFDIVYLRRTVNVKHFHIDLPSAPSTPLIVDGRMIVKQTHYTVFIDFSGSAQHPNILLSSEPYLPTSEVVSVLLYDRTSDELISADAATSANVQAAIADRAIGLFGIWAFAGTPIKGFSYNPINQIYSASIQLPDNLTATIGTNWEESKQVELRKRISKRWMLMASWQSSDESESLKKLTLQWEKRF